MADAEPIEVRNRGPDADVRGGDRRMPEREQILLDFDESGMRARESLRFGVVYLIEDNVVRGSA